MAKYVGIVLCVCMALGMVWLIGCETRKGEKPQALAEVTKGDADAEFFAYIERVSKNETQKQKYMEVVEKLTQIVGEEARKNPQAMSSHIEEMIRLVPKAGPGIAIQFEEYANAAVREEMNQLRQESSVGELLKLKDELARVSNEYKKISEQAKLFSVKVPVLLFNAWVDAMAVIKVTSKSTQEINTYTLSPKKYGSPFDSSEVAYLEPGEYTVEFSCKQSAEDKEVFCSQSILAVMKEPLSTFRGEVVEKQYHAAVFTPGFDAKKN